MDDFITGVDVLTERDVIDYTVNSCGEYFCELLLNANDFTYVSIKGSSVVDYCVIPYENLRHYRNFEVMRASVVIKVQYLVYSTQNTYRIIQYCVGNLKPIFQLKNQIVFIIM